LSNLTCLKFGLCNSKIKPELAEWIDEHSMFEQSEEDIRNNVQRSYIDSDPYWRNTQRCDDEVKADIRSR